MSLQRPIGSGFGASSTTEDVLAGKQLDGTVAVVTGANSGLGFEAARALRGAGTQVFVVDRQLDRAAAYFDRDRLVTLEQMDLTDPASIDACAKRITERVEKIDIQLNSAGIMACPLSRDTRGYERHLSTNHLGHFQLTARLWDALVRGEQTRVVAFSSLGHRYSDIVFDDLHYEHREYNPYAAYGQSKTANALFAVELDRRGQRRGIRAFAVHPGAIPGTGLERFIPKDDLIEAGMITPDGTPILDPTRFVKSPAQGAATAVWCATSPMLEGLGGLYCENCDIACLMETSPLGTTIADATHLTGVRPYAVDPERAARLWRVTEELVGVEFPAA